MVRTKMKKQIYNVVTWEKFYLTVILRCFSGKRKKKNKIKKETQNIEEADTDISSHGMCYINCDMNTVFQFSIIF